MKVAQPPCQHLNVRVAAIVYLPSFFPPPSAPTPAELFWLPSLLAILAFYLLPPLLGDSACEPRSRNKTRLLPNLGDAGQPSITETRAREPPRTTGTRPGRRPGRWGLIPPRKTLLLGWEKRIGDTTFPGSAGQPPPPLPHHFPVLSGAAPLRPPRTRFMWSSRNFRSRSSRFCAAAASAAVLGRASSSEPEP